MPAALRLARRETPLAVGPAARTPAAAPLEAVIPVDRAERDAAAERAAALALPRAHVSAEPPPEAPAGWWARVARVFREHRPAVGAVLMGATAIPGVVGAPAVAHADPAPTTPASTATPAAPVTTAPEPAVDLARSVLFGPGSGPGPGPGALAGTRTSDTAPSLAMRPPSLDRLETTLPDGRTVNLFPTQAELARWLADGSLGPSAPGPRAPVGPGPRAPAGPGTAAPTNGATRDGALDGLLSGVPATVRSEPWQASFDDYFRARAAVSEVPTALAGLALRPAADGLYRVVDQIPAPIRRPFDRALGIILDNAVSIPANALTPRIPLRLPALPASRQLDLPAYPQMQNSCGETMVATWLKAQGVPIALGELDTQTSFFEGTNLLEDAELRSRGFSIISGPGSMSDLRTYVANGYPVMVSVGWPNGGGHYAVVTGYDDATRTLTIDSYRADGQVARVSYDEFAADWGRHANLMTVAHPQRDARLGALRSAGRLSRTPQVQEGLSLSDIWVNQRLQFFVEAAYRYRGTSDDLTVRLNVTSSQSRNSTADMFGGSVRYSHRFDDGTTVDLYAERIAEKSPGDSDSLASVLRSTAVYVGARHGPVSGRAGYERGAFQAQLQAELNRRLLNLGAEARVSVGPNGHYNVFVGVAGTF